jgi:lysyl-tRNA synthetase, class II
MMDLTEEIVCGAALKVCGGLNITYQGQDVNLNRPWRRVAMNDLVKEEIGFDFDALRQSSSSSSSSSSLDKLLKAKSVAEEHGVPGVNDVHSVGEVLNLCFEHLCEHKLVSNNHTYIFIYSTNFSLYSTLFHTFQLKLSPLFYSYFCRKKVQPTFVTDHPIEISPLAKPHRSKHGRCGEDCYYYNCMFLSLHTALVFVRINIYGHME